MRARSIALVAVLVLLAGIGGYALRGAAERPQPPPASAPETASRPTPRAVPVQVVPEPRSPAPDPVAPARQPVPERPRRPLPESSGDKRARIDRMTQEYLATLKIPPLVAAEATTLKVTDDGLRAMYAAELLLHYSARQSQDAELKQATDDALATLAARGDEGFFAVAANARGAPENTSRVDAMAKATWRAGLERALLDWLRAEPPRTSVMQPLRALGAIDTVEVRVFLRGALVTYGEHASNFAAAAASLGALHDGEAAGVVASKLRRNEWSGLRPGILDSLGRMGGSEAQRVLVEYLRDPEGESESSGLEALALLDPAGARAEAEALVAGTSPNKLSAIEAGRVRQFLAK